MAGERLARFEAHVDEGFGESVAFAEGRKRWRVRESAWLMETPMPGLVPQVIIGSSASPSMVTSRSNFAPSSVGSLRQRATAASQSAPFGAKWRPLQILESGVVGRDHACARAGFDRHVADRHAAFHIERADGRAGVFEDACRCRRRCRSGR